MSKNRILVIEDDKDIADSIIRECDSVIHVIVGTSSSTRLILS